MPALVGDDHTVGIAIQRDTEIGACLAHLLAHQLGRGGAAFLVDVRAIGIIAHLDDLGTQLPQGGGRDAIGRTVGRIDHDAKPVQRHVLRIGALPDLECLARLELITGHPVGVLVGNEQQYTNSQGFGADRRGQTDIFYDEFQGGFASIVPAGNFFGKNYLVSFLGRLN